MGYMKKEKMKMSYSKNTNEDALRIMNLEILKAEKDNVKTHEKKDTEMIDAIIDIIVSEVDRIRED